MGKKKGGKRKSNNNFSNAQKQKQTPKKPQMTKEQKERLSTLQNFDCGKNPYCSVFFKKRRNALKKIKAVEKLKDKEPDTLNPDERAKIASQTALQAEFDKWDGLWLEMKGIAYDQSQQEPEKAEESLNVKQVDAPEVQVQVVDNSEEYLSRLLLLLHTTLLFDTKDPESVNSVLDQLQNLKLTLTPPQLAALQRFSVGLQGGYQTNGSPEDVLKGSIELAMKFCTLSTEQDTMYTNLQFNQLNEIVNRIAQTPTFTQPR